MVKIRLAPDFTLPDDAVTQTFAILARRGVGKTYTALVLVEELLGAGAQAVIADPRDRACPPLTRRLRRCDKLPASSRCISRMGR